MSRRLASLRTCMAHLDSDTEEGFNCGYCPVAVHPTEETEARTCRSHDSLRRVLPHDLSRHTAICVYFWPPREFAAGRCSDLCGRTAIRHQPSRDVSTISQQLRL